jgi:mitogen-activated protein kinase organizer 1
MMAKNCNPDPSLPPLPSSVYQTLLGHKGLVTALSFTADGSYLLSGGADRTVRLWNPHKLSSLANSLTTPIQVYAGIHGYDISSLSFDSNCAQFLSAGGDRTVFCVSIETNQVIRRLRGHTQRINSVKYAALGDSIAITASSDTTVKLFDLRNNQGSNAVQTLEEAKDSVTCVMINDTQLITSSMDGFVRNYDIRTASIINDYISEAGLTNLALTKDKNCLLIGTLDEVIRLFDLNTGTLLNEYMGHKNKKLKIDCGFACNDSYVMSGSEDGSIYVWGLVDNQIVKVYQSVVNNNGVLTSVIAHPSQDCIISAGEDGVIKVWK